MLFNIIIFFGILLILSIFLTQNQYINERFEPIPVVGNSDFAKETKMRTDTTNLGINVLNPQISLNTITKQKLESAINTPTIKETFDVLQDNKVEILDDLSKEIRLAKGCESAPKTCNMFDMPEYSTCGYSFDKNGTASDGTAYPGGGLYVSMVDNRVQKEYLAPNALKDGKDPFNVYQPTLGSVEKGKFALTKDDCIIVKERIDCKEKQNFETPNCTQCLSSEEFTRLDPNTPRIPFKMIFQGKGLLSISSTDNLITLNETELRGNNRIELPLPSDSEGKTFNVTLKTSSQLPTYLVGVVVGDTARGPYKFDFRNFVQTDRVTNAKPKLMGTQMIDDFQSLSIVPGNRQKSMVLACMVPFSFISMYEIDALYCDNGPFVTKESSATFLESNPCFGKANKPGNYKLECLQDRWTALGGLPEGTGYPSTPEKANALQKDSNGNPLTIGKITDILSVKMRKAITGKDENGRTLTVPEWNEVSMWGLGIPITTPCDGINKDTGPLSRECLSFLYKNQGQGTRIGSTYTLNNKYAYKEGWEDVNATRYPYPNTPMSPNTEVGRQFADRIDGGVTEFINAYNVELNKANDNTFTNALRAQSIKNSYDIDVPNPSSNSTPGDPQVYAVGPGYQYTRQEAPSVCAKYGATVATTAQLQEAQQKGADWCFSGWVTEGSGKWPITLNPISGCGDRQGIIEWTPGERAGVNCYGPKPSPESSLSDNIFPFNANSWFQPTSPTYFTVPSGYLETNGDQPACFNKLTPEQAKKNCDAYGPRCVGFSYSKDGNGHGCYKGNHNAGINRNPNYMGYVKSPINTLSGNVFGRYIRLEYNRQECLNLAQILVFSSQNGPNLITPNTRVSKSSGFGGDIFPNQNFVNQKGHQHYNFVHTSCYDVPWIEVDIGSLIQIYKVVVWNRVDCCLERILGTTLKILDEERNPVYISSPINRTVQSYTWLPPNPNALLNVDPIKRKMNVKPTDWKCLWDIPVPLRRNNNGDIECMSTNAHDCLWGNWWTCNQYKNSKPNNIRPLACGAHHTRQWGGPGYDNPGHWCARADNNPEFN